MFIAPPTFPAVDPYALGAELCLWLKADAGVTEAGGVVSAWLDQSANAYNFTQATAANRPDIVTNVVNGLPVISFTSTSDYLTHDAGVSAAWKFLHDGTQDYAVLWMGRRNIGSGVHAAVLSTFRATSEIGCQITGLSINEIRTGIGRGTAGVLALSSVQVPLYALNAGYRIQCTEFRPSVGANNCHYTRNYLTGLGYASRTNSYSTANPSSPLTICGMNSSGVVNEKGGWNLGELIILKTSNIRIIKGVARYLKQRWAVTVP